MLCDVGLLRRAWFILWRYSFVRIDMRLGELSSRHLLHEQYVQLFICTVLDLRQTEVRPDENEECCAAPEKAALATPIPLYRIDHVRIQELRDDVDDLIRCS